MRRSCMHVASYKRVVRVCGRLPINGRPRVNEVATRNRVLVQASVGSVSPGYRSPRPDRIDYQQAAPHSRWWSGWPP